jgi:hypothetical protein
VCKLQCWRGRSLLEGSAALALHATVCQTRLEKQGVASDGWGVLARPANCSGAERTVRAWVAPTPTLPAWRARRLRQARLASGEDVFGPLIRRFILDNKHRVTVEVRMWTRMCAVVRGCAAWRACLSAGLTVVCALEESRQEAVLPSLQRASGEHYKRCPLSFSDKSVCTEVTPRL